MSLAAADRARRKAMGSTALFGAGAVVVGVILSVVVGGMVSRPVRMLTRDMAIVRTGNFEHRTAVATADEIGVLAAAFNEMTAGLQESERMRNDLRLAQDIQAKLLPSKLPKIEGYDLAARYRPATEVSGDYYDVFLLPDGRFGIAVGDVSGKGVAAGLVMTMTRALVRMGALGGLPPKKLLSRINSVLFQDLKRGAFVTLLYAIIDPREGLVRFASAGHNPLCVWQPKEGKVIDVEATGIALGVAAPPVFDARTQEVTYTLPPDGRFLVYTDGVTEAMSKDHEQYGEERLRGIVQSAGQESSERLLRRLLEDIDLHRKDAPPWDDITIVGVRRMAESAPKVSSESTPSREHPQDETSFLTDTSRRISAMRGDLVIKVEPKPDGGGLIRILGSVDAHTFSDLEHAFKKLESIGAIWVVVDLSAMTYISSVGLNFIVNRRVHLVQNDGDVTLAVQVARRPARRDARALRRASRHRHGRAGVGPARRPGRSPGDGLIRLGRSERIGRPSEAVFVGCARGRSRDRLDPPQGRNGEVGYRHPRPGGRQVRRPSDLPDRHRPGGDHPRGVGRDRDVPVHSRSDGQAAREAGPGHRGPDHQQHLQPPGLPGHVRDGRRRPFRRPDADGRRGRPVTPALTPSAA